MPNGALATVGLYRSLGAMNGGQISEMLLNVDAIPNHARRREMRERLVDYITMTDPERALELRDTIDGQNILNKSFKQLGRNGLVGALAVMEKLEDPRDRRKALLSAFVGASEIDPAGAFASLKTTPGVGPSHYHEVFDNWAETDPLAAARAALTVENPSDRRSALKIVGQEWAERDPQAVLDWLDTVQLSSYERESIRKSALAGISRRDPKAALEILAGVDQGTRNRILPDTIRYLADKDPQAAIDWIRQAPDGYAKNKAMEEALGELAQKAPLETIEIADNYPEMRENALVNAFGTLARNDLPDAMERLKAYEGDPVYSNLLRNLASSYAREKPEEALAWALDLPSEHRSQVLGSVVSNMSRVDPELAIKNLDKLATDENRSYHDSAVQNIASNWARRDPFAAAAWLQSLPDSNGKTNGISQVVHQLAEVDPVSAAEFLQTLPESPNKIQSISQVADQWARVDPVSASEWIGGLPAGPNRDAAASTLVNRIQRHDPERAIAWAESISDENNRNSHLRNVYRDWLRTDNTAALQSLAGSGLPDQMKRSLVPELNQDQPRLDSSPQLRAIEFEGSLRLDQ